MLQWTHVAVSGACYECLIAPEHQTGDHLVGLQRVGLEERVWADRLWYELLEHPHHLRRRGRSDKGGREGRKESEIMVGIGEKRTERV